MYIHFSFTLERFFRTLGSRFVGMCFDGELAVLLLDLGNSRCLGKVKDFVVVIASFENPFYVLVFYAGCVNRSTIGLTGLAGLAVVVGISGRVPVVKIVPVKVLMMSLLLLALLALFLSLDPLEKMLGTGVGIQLVGFLQEVYRLLGVPFPQ